MKTENRPHRRDLHPTQELLLVTVIGALNAGHEASARDLDLDRLRAGSGARWSNVDALLLDYTMARLIAACPGGIPPFDASVRGADEIFIRAFTAAVVANDVALATYLWADINFGWKEQPGVHLPSMIVLLARLRAYWAPVTLEEIRDRLAPEFAELA